MDLTGIALQGLQQADVQLNQAAAGIASYGAAASTTGANVDTVDLSAEVVALMSAKNQNAVNLKTLQTGNEIQKTTIDLMA